MIFEWSRPSGTWVLVADDGAEIGTARRCLCPVPSGIGGEGWQATMTPAFGGREAWSRDLDLIRTWMIREAQIARADA